MVDTQKFANDPKRPQGVDGTLQVGAVLQSRFKITGVLGVGGMGSVYQARDMHFPAVQRHVAVKEMLNMATDPSLREMTLKNFEREANILAELNHPAIPKIYDYFSNKDRAYLVMEYINGRDLEAYVNSMPDFLPTDLVMRWATDLCDVLNYLHTHQPEAIIFRDMKPSNIMVDGQGNVRLIDFGIAKTFQMNQKGTMIGTEGYSPPEQYRGEASPAGDIYALGATLHHLLTRRDPRLEPPFSFAERPLRQANPKVPAEFETVVMRALSYESTDRYSTAGAMKEAIESLNRPTMSAFAAGGAAVRPSGEESGTTAFQEAGKLTAVWKFKCEDEIRSTPIVYRGIVYVGAYDNNLYALGAKDGAFKWKFPTEGGIAGTPAIAVDENLVIFGSEDGTLYAVDIAKGKVSWTFKAAGPIRGSVNVTSGHVFFGSDDGKMYAVRLNTGRMVWKFDAGNPVRSRPAVTSDRIVVGVENGDVVGLDLAGAVKWRFKAKRAVTSSPVIHEDIAYVGSVDWHVYALDVTSGWAAWRVRTGKPVISSPIVVDKTLYIGSADGHLYALDITANGRELWKFEAPNQIVSTPAYHNGAVYFGCVDKNVYSIETKKGKLRWDFETGGPIASSACIADGLLYIGSTDHNLYALNP
jgi:outer membrane protein assembly factor BamB/tRNA A-37 threonylcarbamoyl transferase component Bud32